MRLFSAVLVNAYDGYVAATPTTAIGPTQEEATRALEAAFRERFCLPEEDGTAWFARIAAGQDPHLSLYVGELRAAR